MPLGQLFTSLAAARGAIGNPVSEGIDFSNNLYNETSLLDFINWALNLTSDFSAKENPKEELNGVESTTIHYNNTTPNYPDIHNVDSLSIMWYLASFGTLVMFFLLISFSEVCCKKSMTVTQEDETEVSPPPYDLFAPPTYDSLYEKKREKNNKRKKLRKCEVFVIKVFGDKNKLAEPPSESSQEGGRRDPSDHWSFR